MKPVIQQDVSGCGIASVAAIANQSYASVKEVAHTMGIFVEDGSLWSSIEPVRRVLMKLGINSDAKTQDFSTWDALPNCALLAIKWHVDNNKPYWHWVVFVRDEAGSYVLDSKKELSTNRRTDFGRIKPKWYLPIYYYGQE